MQRARINGIELAYELRGTGLPMVMIHGAQGDQTMFTDLAHRFADHFRVLTFDQRGSGLSEKPHTAYSIALLADDTAALMEHVGFSPAHVIGVSMGGTIAQELVLRHARKVSSLILGCTTPGGPKAVRIGGSAFAAANSRSAALPRRCRSAGRSGESIHRSQYSSMASGAQLRQNGAGPAARRPIRSLADHETGA